LLFISDMGDILSKGISFDYLYKEIIEVVSAENGRRHIRQWLSKRPGKMAKFGSWLAERGIKWPANLVAMTSVTSMKTAARLDLLRKVPAKIRGVSVEPLWGPVKLDLNEIDWVICGGASGGNAKPFDLAWARDLRDECRAAKVSFFMKQLGANPIENGESLKLENSHGGNWDEWPRDLKVRQFPDAFRLGDVFKSSTKAGGRKL
jgi:protein gp37